MTTLLLKLNLSNYYYINEPAVFMRDTSDPKSEKVSQAFFSEKVSVEELSGNYAFIKSSDGYPGWVPIHTLSSLSNPYEGALKVSSVVAPIYDGADTECEILQKLPFGSGLSLVESISPRWNKVQFLDVSTSYNEIEPARFKEGFVQVGDVTPQTITHKKDLIALSKQFLHLPYTWAGRSSLGYDCSAFVQMLYKEMGLNIPRDARDQINDPQLKEVDLYECEPGDLIFFGKTNGRITHVGMYIGDNEFIHAVAQENKPWIRISKLSDPTWDGTETAICPLRIAKRPQKLETSNILNSILQKGKDALKSLKIF